MVNELERALLKVQLSEVFMKLVNKVLPAFLIFSGLIATGFAHATATETVKEAVEDTKKGAKKLGRDAKDATCKMIKGKLECAGEKVKHKVQNGVDEVKDKVDDVKKSE